MLTQFFLPRIHVHIRRAERKDLSQLDWDSGPDLDERESHLHEQSQGQALFLVAAVADRPIGTAQVTWAGVGHAREHPEITHLGVFDALKGYGVGTALLEACEHACRDRGFEKVALRVDPVTEPRWRVLYERLGYRFSSARNATHQDEAADGTPTISLELVKEL